MAESLSGWLSTSISRTIASEGRFVHTDRPDDDTAFSKGSKVQILRFAGFTADGRLPDVWSDDLEEGSAEFSSASTTTSTVASDARSAGNKQALWAKVGDRKSWVYVRFSKACVEWFESIHTRPLLSLRGTIIGLQWLRPALSVYAAHLHAVESDSSRTGPFATRGDAAAMTKCTPEEMLEPRLYLDVQKIFLWGSINEVIFWETYDLQVQLLPIEASSSDEETHVRKPNSVVVPSEYARAVRHWFAKTSRKVKRRAAKRQSRHAELKLKRQVHSVESGTKRSQETSGYQSSLQTASSTLSLPPPFQRPPRDRQVATLNGNAMAHAATSTPAAYHTDDGEDTSADGQPLQLGSGAEEESLFVLSAERSEPHGAPSDSLALSAFDAPNGNLEAWRMTDTADQSASSGARPNESPLSDNRLAYDSDRSQSVADSAFDGARRTVAGKRPRASSLECIGDSSEHRSALKYSSADPHDAVADEEPLWSELIDVEDG